MINRRIVTFTTALIVFLTILYSSCFFVKQGNESVILRFGELNSKDGKVTIYKPGLHFKIPVVEEVKSYDMRLHTLTVDSSRVVTSEQKDVIVNAYLEWRISDVSQFYRSVSGLYSKAESLLQQFLESSLRAEIGRNDVQSLINNERDKVMSKLTNSVGEQSKNIGISVIDVRIKQIDLPDTVTDSIYKRMCSERQKVASSIRAQGEQLSESIRASADANAVVILAKANSDAKKIRAIAEATAANIYIESYSKSFEFYDYWRSMRSYQHSFSNKQDSVFFLEPNSRFLNYFG